MSGWIKLHRDIENWAWFNDSKMFHFWIILLMMANHKNNNWNGHSIKKGQLLTGRKALSRKANVSESTIERWLNRLEKEQQILQEKTNKFRKITILNWEKYQEFEQQTDNKRTTKEQQKDTNKNEKNVKKERNREVDQIGEMWNTMAKINKLPKVKLPVGKDRVKKVLPALKEFNSPDDWIAIISQIEKNPFNLGQNDRNWKANFDWLFHTTKFNYRKLWEEHESENSNSKNI